MAHSWHSIVCLSPQLGYYLEPAVSDIARNIIWSAVMYYVTRPPKSRNLPYEGAAGALDAGYKIRKHGTAARPVEARLGSSLQIGHLLQFLDQHRTTLFPGDVVPAVRMHVRIEGGPYFPVSL
jgi:hypothetical protein